MGALTIDLNAVLQLTDEQFAQICQANPTLKFERTASGELLIMSPTGGETGRQNVEIAADFVIWNRQTKLAETLISSRLSNYQN